MVKVNIKDIDETLTKAELDEIKKAAAKEPFFDDDSPEMPQDKLQQLQKMYGKTRTKQTISLRLSPETLSKAKMYGKGYTSFLSRLLDEAINDEELIRKCI